MRKTLVLLLLAAMLGMLPGCLTTDRDHNRNHFRVMRRDLHYLHRDIDHAMKWHESSGLINREEP